MDGLVNGGGVEDELVVILNWEKPCAGVKSPDFGPAQGFSKEILVLHKVSEGFSQFKHHLEQMLPGWLSVLEVHWKCLELMIY